MRKLLVLLAVVVVLIAALLLTSKRSSPGRGGGDSTADAAPAQAELEQPAGEQVSTRLALESQSGTETAITTAVAAALPHAHVFGRIVDGRGAPIGGCDLRLYTPVGRWSSLEGRTRSANGTSEPEEWKAGTDAQGRFSFDVPAPTSSRQSLDVDPTPLFRRFECSFGSLGDAHTALTAGENDLGDLVAESGAALTGRVVDTRGVGLAHAWVHADLMRSEPRSMPVETDADGAFVLGSLAPGTRSLGVWCERRRSVKGIAAEAVAGELVQLDPIVLAPAEVLSGVVVDPQGVPLAEVPITAVPAQGSTKSGARSQADGAFVLTLQEDGPHFLSVPTSGVWTGLQDPATANQSFAPGTSGLRLVVRLAPRITFRVIDRATRAPIESFGLRVRNKRPKANYQEAFDGLEPEEHPRGEATQPARVGEQEVIVDAPAYAPYQGDVTRDAGSETVQTIALDLGGELHGRVLLGADPAVGATVNLYAESLDEKTGEPRGSLEGWTSGTRRDLEGYAARRRCLVTSSDADFRFQGLATGTYALEIRTRGANTGYVRGVSVAAGSTRDAGAIGLQAGGLVRGRLIAPVGESPLGFRVRLMPERVDRRVADFRAVRSLRVSRGDGTFEFSELAPASYVVTWERPTREEGFTFGTPSADALRVDVTPGSTRDVLIDASGSAVCTVSVRVRRAGAPLAGAQIRLDIQRPEQPGTWNTAEAWSGDAPTRTDPSGVAVGQVEGGVRIRIAVLDPDDHSVLYRSDEEIETPPGGRIEREVVIDTGTLVLELPPGLTPPPRGRVEIGLTPDHGQPIRIRASTASKSMGSQRILWEGSSLALGSVPTGHYRVRVSCFEDVADPQDPRRMQSNLLRPTFEGEVDVRTDSTSRIVVP